MSLKILTLEKIMQTSGTNSEHLFTVDTIVWLNIRSFNVEKRPTSECLQVFTVGATGLHNFFQC